MFKDYYQILDILQNSSQREIKIGFKKQAILWHPDKNPEIDTTEQMQNINEAFLILKDVDARERYDIEYSLYKSSINNQEKNEHFTHKKNTSSEEYVVNDDILNNWMNNAKKQSVDLAKQTIEDFKKIAKDGVDGARKGITNQIIGTILFFIIISLIKTCKN